MYKAGDYFVECIATRDDDYGWRCIVRFSRMRDHRAGGMVPRVVKISPSIMETSRAAEYEAVLWARSYIESNGAQLEGAFAA